MEHLPEAIAFLVGMAVMLLAQIAFYVQAARSVEAPLLPRSRRQAKATKGSPMMGAAPPPHTHEWRHSSTDYTNGKKYVVQTCWDHAEGPAVQRVEVPEV